MLGIHDFWLFVAAGWLLNITPGPDVAYIVGRSAQLGLRGGVTAAIAVATGCMIHITAAALGVSALIAASALAFTALKWMGAAYLIYIGVRMIFSARAASTETAFAARSGTSPVALRVVFWQGFLTNALNPKVALFFLAFLPQFIDPAAPSKGLAFLALGLVFNVNGTIWNLCVAWFAAKALGLGPVARARVGLERAIGGF